MCVNMKKTKMNVLAVQKNSKELLKLPPKNGKHFKNSTPHNCEKIVLDEGCLFLQKLNHHDIDDEY